MHAAGRHIATLMLGAVLALSGLLPSCVAPNEIEVINRNQWTVFGLVGEDRPPVIFLYRLSLRAGFVYHESATIVLEHTVTGTEVPLVPTIAGGELDYSFNEFPFDEDLLGRIIYYTTPGGLPIPAGNYTVHLDTGDRHAKCSLYQPEAVPFSRVEILRSVNGNGNTVSWLHMGIDDIPGEDLYKWEVRVDQVVPVQVAVDFDPDTGEPTAFAEDPVTIRFEATPNNYITEERIEDAENDFRFNLSANLPDFDYTEETYFISVRLRHYEDALAAYFQSITDQQDGAVFDPFFEPVFIQSNIDGLPGVIASYVYSEEIILEYQP